MTEVIETTGEPVPEKKKGRKPKADKSTALAVNTEKLQTEETYGRDVLDYVSKWPLATQTDVDQAGELLAEVVEKKKALEAELKTITAPMREAEKNVRNLFKPAIQFFESAETTIKGKLRQFVLDQKAEQDKALAAIAASGGTADASTLVAAHGHNHLEMTENANTRRVLDFKVLDLAQVPEKFFIRVLNEDAIRAEIKVTDGKCQIPGIEVFEDVKIVNARRS